MVVKRRRKPPVLHFYMSRTVVILAGKKKQKRITKPTGWNLFKEPYKCTFSPVEKKINKKTAPANQMENTHYLGFPAFHHQF